jgi:hypothetical protein
VADTITEIHQRSRGTYGRRRVRAALLADNIYPDCLVLLIRFSSSCRIRYLYDTKMRIPTQSLRTYSGKKCRFSFFVADVDSPTCMFAEFSSKWRTSFSHLRGGS